MVLFANNFRKEEIATTTTTTVATILEAVTSFVTSSVGWITSYAGAITSNPLILTFVIMAIAGMGVGLIRRLVRI